MLIFALEQKLKVHWNGLQRTFLLSYCTSKSEQAENSLVHPRYYDKKYLKIVINHEPNVMYRNKLTFLLR